jgi:hypothetical protein
LNDSRTRAANNYTDYTISPFSSLHQQTPHALSTTGAAPDSSLVCSIVIVFYSGPFALSEGLAGSAMLLYRVTPEAELFVDRFFSSDVEVDMDPKRLVHPRAYRRLTLSMFYRCD